MLHFSFQVEGQEVIGNGIRDKARTEDMDELMESQKSGCVCERERERKKDNVQLKL